MRFDSLATQFYNNLPYGSKYLCHTCKYSRVYACTGTETTYDLTEEGEPTEWPKERVIQGLRNFVRGEHLVNFQIIEDILVVMEEVQAVHSLITNSDIIKDQTVYQALLHPPEQLGLVLHPGGGRHGDVLES